MIIYCSTVLSHNTQYWQKWFICNLLNIQNFLKMGAEQKFLLIYDDFVDHIAGIKKAIATIGTLN